MRRLLTVIIILTACKSKNEQASKTVGLNNDTIPQVSNQTLIVNDSNVRVWAHDSNTRKEIDRIDIRFEPYISFKDFPVNNIYKGSKATLYLDKTMEGFWMFRTRIRQGYDTVNFAGKYCFVQWGCGSSCQLSAIIDAATGKIYAGPDASLGYEFRIDSRMIVVNPPNKHNDDDPYHSDSSFYRSDCIYCQPLIYIWNEEQKIFEERKAGYK